MPFHQRLDTNDFSPIISPPLSTRIYSNFQLNRPHCKGATALVSMLDLRKTLWKLVIQIDEKCCNIFTRMQDSSLINGT
jgi:hypothetical protein